MKTLLFSFILLFGVNFLTNGQCNYSFPCSNPIHSSCLNNTSYTGDQCFYGPMIINTSNNWNNFMNLSFQNDVHVQQTINIPQGGNIYSDGSNDFASVNFQGNGKMYISGQQTIIYQMNSNNSNSGSENIIYLINGSTLIYNNVQYYVGDIIQLPGNLSNRVFIYGCTNTVLPITFESFELKGGKLYWKVDLYEGVPLQIEYASNAEPSYFIASEVTSNLTGSIKAEIGFYRLRVGMKVSKIIRVTPSNMSSETVSSGRKIDLVTGKVITDPRIFQPYIQDGKIKEIVQ